MSEIHDDYVAGDINTIDDDAEDSFVETANADKAVTAKAALEYIASSLAENPADVSVEASDRQGKVVFSLTVGPNDMGRIIGRRGRTAQAIRAIVGAAGARDGVTTSVDIVD